MFWRAAHSPVDTQRDGLVLPFVAHVAKLRDPGQPSLFPNESQFATFSLSICVLQLDVIISS